MSVNGFSGRSFELLQQESTTCVCKNCTTVGRFEEQIVFRTMMNPSPAGPNASNSGTIDTQTPQVSVSSEPPWTSEDMILSVNGETFQTLPVKRLPLRPLRQLFVCVNEPHQRNQQTFRSNVVPLSAGGRLCSPPTSAVRALASMHAFTPMRCTCNGEGDTLPRLILTSPSDHSTMYG